MSANALRTPARLFAVGALLWVLTSCSGSRPIPCEAPAGSNSSTCICSSGTSACPVTPGPEFLYATAVTSTGGQILSFSVDRNSGGLTPIGSVPGPSISLGLTAVSNQFLYASDTHNSQVDGFSINQTTGVLTALTGSPFSTGTLSVPGALASPPGILASSPGSNLLYVADSGTVDTFTISTAGVPAALPGAPFLPETGFSIAVDPSGQFLYAADDDPPGGIFAFTIDSTGALTAVPGSPFTIPGQTAANSLPLGIVDTGTYVYAALSQTNQIAAFSIVSGTGALTPVPNSPFPAGTVPSALVWNGSLLSPGNLLYAINSSDGTISGYSINSTNGVLTPVSGSPFSIVGLSMTTDSFGQLLYVASPIGIQAFTINISSGALTPVTGSPFAASATTLLSMVQIPPP